MIKSTAVVLGFLFGLSTAYYLSFWSYFNIDVFQYIAIGDIIKGIAYPLRFAGVWIIGLFVFATFLITLSTFAEEKRIGNNLKKAIILFTIISVLMAIFYALTSSSRLTGMTLSIVLSVLVVVIYFTFNNIHLTEKAKAVSIKEKYEDEHPVENFFKMFTIYCIVFLPINAIVAGQIDARAIHAGKRYNYIMSQDFPKDKIDTKQPYLVFLGAVSEKYIFIDRSENEQFIIDKSELPVMRIHHFDSSDKASIAHLSTCMDRKRGLPLR